MEDEDFLEEIGKDDEAETTEEPVTVTEEAPAEPVAEPVAVEPVAEPAKPEPGFVPFAAVLDERDKRKKLEQENEELRKRNQTPVQPQPIPDMFEDPDGYTTALAQTFEQRLYQQQLQMSERFARNQFGDEATDAALAWATSRCDTDPYFNAQVRASTDPVGHAVREYQRDQIASSVTPDDFKQFMAWKQAQTGLTPEPATQQETPSPAKPPPRSLASAPSAGSVNSEPVQSDEEIFAETFARK